MVCDNERFGEAFFTPAEDINDLKVALCEKYGEGELAIGTKRDMLRLVQDTFEEGAHDSFRLAWQSAANDALVGVFLPDDDRELPVALMRAPGSKYIQ